MAKPTIPQILGDGSTRLASAEPAPSSGLFIPDSVFVSAGLGTPATATAEAHLVALLVTVKIYLTQLNFDANIDQSIYVESGFTSFIQRGTDNISYRVDQPFNFNLAKIDEGITIDPTQY
ncbi:hypothetical protein FJR38_26940 [Anabaena sp. UHCC 0253]|uniref:hypothetical protein n=1 Tax=Anabaena sp. UHCC 0253 TaxID=2590019 RepID=UPI001448720C|nr:hypothetical protein [Anabaena sp. UHCC 0253]MTJ56027.1 hypothetical protein [Anabaena sp. UHCC 0253]